MSVNWLRAPDCIEEFFHLPEVRHDELCCPPHKSSLVVMDGNSVTLGWDSDGVLWTLGIDGFCLVRREVRRPE